MFHLLTDAECDRLITEISGIPSDSLARSLCRRYTWEILRRINDDDDRRHHYSVLARFQRSVRQLSTWAYWENLMNKFLEEVVIIAEVYDVKPGYIIKRREVIMALDDGDMVETDSQMTYGTYDIASSEYFDLSSVMRTNYGTNLCSHASVREYVDRYVEVITKEHHYIGPNRNNISSQRVINKRDLFRDEVSRPALNELLYSPDIILRFPTLTNEATRAKDHYRSLL